MSSCKDVSSCYQLMFIDYLGLNRAYVTFNRLMLSWIWYPRWSRINQISLLKILTLRTLLMSRVLWEDLFIFYDQMTLTNSIWYGISASECVCVLWSVSFAYLTVMDLVWLEAGVTALALQTQYKMYNGVKCCLFRSSGWGLENNCGFKFLVPWGGSSDVTILVCGNSWLAFYFI